jgi:hypothetical protein
MVQARRTIAEADLCVTALWLQNKGSWRAALYVGQEPTGTVWGNRAAAEASEPFWVHSTSINGECVDRCTVPAANYSFSTLPLWLNDTRPHFISLFATPGSGINFRFQILLLLNRLNHKSASTRCHEWTAQVSRLCPETDLLVGLLVDIALWLL